MVLRASELGLGAIALCDLDGIYGCVRAWNQAKELGQPLIIGAELSLVESPTDPLPGDDAPTVALLVQTLKGYENLCRLLTRGHDGRPKGECACVPAWLREHAEGLLAIVPAPRIPLEDFEPSDRLLEVLREAFPERLFLAAYRHLDGFDSARLRWAEKNSVRHGVPIIASARPQYHLRTRKPLSDVVHCIRRGTTLDEAGTELGANTEAHLRSEAEMQKLFEKHPEWLERTADIARSIEFDFSQLRYHFPCELEPDQTADERLAELTWEGVGRRYPNGAPEALRQQIKKELRLIAKLEVAPYFLSTRDVVEIARRRKILCQGRGSAANSAVCFVLGITAVDPARSKLLFERFLSEERAEPPDIDIDFEHERREEVIQEIYERYGRDRAAMVSEIISYRGKSALREVGKAFGLSLEQVDRLSGTVTHFDTEEARDDRLAEMGFDTKDPRVRQVVALAGQLQGFPRHLSIHVGGFVLSSRPLYEVAPVEPASMEGRTVIPWDKDDIEALGFFKVDVLGLGMLTAIRKALALIVADGGLAARPVRGEGTAAMQRSGAEVGALPFPGRREPSAAELLHDDFDPIEAITRIPPEDPAVYDMICRADTIGVFQIESRAQMAMLPRLRPRRFYDLVIEVAIVRPGPIQGGMVHPYLRRRNGEEPVSCPHPDLWPILERTLGVPLFQEQVMQISIVGAGYSGGQADQLRRDMAAWKKHGKLLSHRDRLLEGFSKKGISRKFGEALFEQIKGFGDYGFPESHASSFALLVYASSWEKAHYPAHFACAIINSQPMGFYQPSTLVRDAQRHGVEVRDVCVVASDWDCTLEPPTEKCAIQSSEPGARRALRLGLRLVKGLGEKAARRIEEARIEAWSEGVKAPSCPFSSLDDLVRRACLAKNEVEALAEAGALEAIVPGRRQALWKARAPRGGELFHAVDVVEPEVKLPGLRSAQQLVLDYGRKGLSVDDHPLSHLRKCLEKQGVVRACDLSGLRRGARVQVAGLVLTRQRPGTASGVVFITLEDETGFANLIVYSNVFERYHHVARHSNLLLVAGEIEREEKQTGTDGGLSAPVGQLSGQGGVSGLSGSSGGGGFPQVTGSETPVIHVIVRHLERLDVPGRGMKKMSRDFH